MWKGWFMAVEMFELSGAIADRVAVDLVHKTAYVDREGSGNPQFLSWIARNRRSGLQLTIKVVEFDELGKLRERLSKLGSNDEDDQLVRAEAIDLIMQAAAFGASDMHLMVRAGHSEIQIVVKGELRVLERKTQEDGAAIARALYQGVAKTRDASYAPYEFQNAQIPGSELPEAGLTSVRIVRGPCYPQAQGGEFMTLRLQYSTARFQTKRTDLPKLEVPRRPAGQFRLGEMGLTAKQIEKVQMLMDTPNGVVIVSGPTGSGKTTLLYECLQELAREKPHRRQVTIEDPVEYPMDWAVQLVVTDAHDEQETGAAFGKRLRVTLRMAPHNILIGELRGADVAAAALEAALTGHQVWTTIHVTDPFLFVDRLELLDSVRLSPKVVCDEKLVRGSIAVRLLPRVCPHCSKLMSEHRDELKPRLVQALETWGDTSKVRLKGPGCDECQGDGTIGRFSVAEVVLTDRELMKDFIECGSAEARDRYQARPDADPSLLESAILRVLAGDVDPRAAEDSVDRITPMKTGRNLRLAA